MRAKEKAIITLTDQSRSDKGKHVGNKPTIFCPSIIQNYGGNHNE